MKIKIVKDSKEGIDYLKKLLYSVVNNKTALFLSGGKTPKDAYSQLALERNINPGAVAMVDERVGVKNYRNSNERMIKETGLLLYFEKKKIPFYPILRSQDYNRQVKYLLGHFSKSVAVMGIGEDGHTAGLPASPKLQRGEPARTQNLKLKTQNYVTEINNFPIEPRERITLTFKALSKMDLLIILAFGENKKIALKKMFEKGSLEEIPARFYTLPEVAKKTILITDQKI